MPTSQTAPPGVSPAFLDPGHPSACASWFTVQPSTCLLRALPRRLSIFRALCRRVVLRDVASTRERTSTMVAVRTLSELSLDLTRSRLLHVALREATTRELVNALVAVVLGAPIPTPA